MTIEKLREAHKLANRITDLQNSVERIDVYFKLECPLVNIPVITNLFKETKQRIVTLATKEIERLEEEFKNL